MQMEMFCACNKISFDDPAHSTWVADGKHCCNEECYMRHTGLLPLTTAGRTRSEHEVAADQRKEVVHI